jgi:hypothetical protein
MSSKHKRLPIDNGFPTKKLPHSPSIIDDKIFHLELELGKEDTESKRESIKKQMEKLEEMLKSENKQQREEDYAQLFTKLGTRLPPGIAEHITSFILPVVGDIVLTNMVTVKNVRGQTDKSGEVELYGLVIDTKEVGRVQQITFIYKDMAVPDGYSIGKSTHYEHPYNIEEKTADELKGFYKQYLKQTQVLRKNIDPKSKWYGTYRHFHKKRGGRKTKRRRHNK